MGSTLAGVLGNSAKVHFRPDLKNNTPGVYNIYIHNADYRFAPEVSRVRDRLRRLGINERITYKPDIFAYLQAIFGVFRLRVIVLDRNAELGECVQAANVL